MKHLLTFLALLVGCDVASAEPISAIIAIATIVSTGGAVVAGTASLLGGLAFAGASLSLVGNITGNEKLARIGAVVSAGAGFASLASGALNAASASDALAEASAGADAAGAAYESSAAANTALSVTPTAVDGVAGAANAAEGAGALSEADAALASASSDATAAGQSYAGTASGADAVGGGALTATPDSNPTDIRLANGTQTSPQIGSGGIKDALSGAGKFIKDNKELVDLGGGLVKGAMQSLSGDDKLKSQREYLEYLKQKDANYSASVVGGAVVPFRVNPNTNVNQVNPQDPTRYVPVRGLVNRAAKG